MKKGEEKMNIMQSNHKRPDINKLNLGDTVRMPLSHLSGMCPQDGTVVYIDPKLRFFTLEFIFGNNRIRESYCAYGPAN